VVDAVLLARVRCRVTLVRCASRCAGHRGEGHRNEDGQDQRDDEVL